MSLAANNLLKGRYRIESVLGQGGMGAVYQATDELLGVSVAVKENLFLSEEYSLQFKEEARILANLRHPNLPRVLDFCSIDGQGQYLVMDYVEGEDLRDLLKQSGPLSEQDVVLIGYHISDALHYMHSQKPMIVHRDVKPGNIKLTADNEVFLVDFGLAKQTSSRSEMTMTGARAMTPGFSPPEQYGTARTDERSDIYSLGATLYNALTGVVPEDALDRVTEKSDLTPILNHRRDTERRLVRVIETAMALHPEDRYQTAKEFQEALLHAARMQSISSDITKLHKFDLNHVHEINENPKSAKPSAVKNKKSKSAVATKKRNWLGWAFLILIIIAGIGLVSMQPEWITGLWTKQQSKTPESIAAAFTETEEPTITVTQTETQVEPSKTDVAPTATQEITVTLTPELTETEDTALQTALTEVLTETTTPTVTSIPSATPRPIGLQDRFPIVFASNRNGTNQLWLMNDDGNDLFQLTNMTNGACQPKWSPDGSQIAFVSPCNNSLDEYPNGMLYIYSFDEKSIVPLLELEDPELKVGNYDPDWSPDGTKIAFTSLRHGVSAVNVYDLITKEVIVLSTVDQEAFHASWHPDGKSIIFVIKDYYSSIWQINADGTNLLQASNSGNISNYHPVWDKEGKFILFSQRNGTQAPWLVRLYAANFGSNIEDKIVIEGITGSFPVLSPIFTTGSDRILFESWPDGKNHDIYSVNVDGTDMIRLTINSSYDFDPDYFHNRLEAEGEAES